MTNKTNSQEMNRRTAYSGTFEQMKGGDEKMESIKKDALIWRVGAKSLAHTGRKRNIAKILANEAYIGGETTSFLYNDEEALMRHFEPESDTDRYLGIAKGLVRAVYKNQVERCGPYATGFGSPVMVNAGVDPTSEEFQREVRNNTRYKTQLLARELVSYAMEKESPWFNLFFRPYVRREVAQRVGRTGERIDRWLAEKIGISKAIDARKEQFEVLREHYQTELEKYIERLSTQA